MGVVQIHKDTSSHKLHFMPLLHLFWQFYSFREVPCVLVDSCHYFRQWKKPEDRGKQVYICLSFCCASESEGGFLLTGGGWYRPCQNWLEAGAGPAGAWLCMVPDCCRLATSALIWPYQDPAQYLYFYPSLSSPHLSYLGHTFTFYQGCAVCMTCLLAWNKPVFKGSSPSLALPISRSPPCSC